MWSFGIVGESFNWFSSYLINRTQYVSINDHISNECTINCGVPHDSVLGPVLFIMYINSLCDMEIDISVITYANCTCLLFSDDK